MFALVFVSCVEWTVPWLEVLFMAMPLSVLGNAMSQTWADRHRIVLITQTRRKLKTLGYTAEHMPKLFPVFVEIFSQIFHDLCLWGHMQRTIVCCFVGMSQAKVFKV